MAKPKYIITKTDYLSARGYVKRKFDDDELFPVDSTSMINRARRSFIQIRDAETLNRWCEQWLNGSQWNLLKSAIRQSRKRVNEKMGKSEYTVGIDLRFEAWAILSNLASRDGITLSDAVVKHLKRKGA